MVKRSWLWGLAGIGIVAVSIGACGDDTATPSGNTGGDSSEELGGSGGAQAGATAERGGEAGESCGPEALADYCSIIKCPTTAGDIEPSCGRSPGDHKTTVRRKSSCGGVAIVEDSGLGGEVWHFDSHGDLVAIDISSDAVTDCSPNGADHYGEQCTLSGPEVDLCQSLDECGPYPVADLCKDEPKSCPASPEEIPLRDYCHIGDLKRYASSCGGTVVETNHDPLGFESWSFDADDHLIGRLITSDLWNKCRDGGKSLSVAYGETCQPQGAGESLCLGAGGTGGAGGAGMADAGGAGGAAP